MRVFITYGDASFKKSLNRIRNEARALKIFDKIIIYTSKDLSDEILRSPLMKYKKGGGYWLWKPYVIWKTMQKYPNAVVVYADAGCTLNKNYNEWNKWFEIMVNVDTLLTYYRKDVDYGWGKYGTSSVEICNWTKRETIDYFDEKFSSQEWHNVSKIWGGFIIAKNNSRFIKELLDIMIRYPNLVNDPSQDELNVQYHYFCEHRHDQSIITPLAYWYANNIPNSVIVIPETGESGKNAAVIASRIRDINIQSTMSKIVQNIKRLLGNKLYSLLHFWK